MTTLHEAAQQALEALEKLVVGSEYEEAVEAERAMDALRAALAEPVQEPVAWQWLDTAHFRKKIPADATPSHWRPLCTAPPQRKPLTDEEISSIWDGHIVPVFGKNGINPVVFARAVERAHGIGGQDEP